MRTCTTQGENKGRKQQRARAPLRQPSATAPTRRDTPKGSKTKSPFCMVLKTYHLTGNHHKTRLKHSNFLNRKLCVQLLPTWNTMATARRQDTEGKQHTPKRVETRFKTRQLQHRNEVISLKPRVGSDDCSSGLHRLQNKRTKHTLRKQGVG